MRGRARVFERLSVSRRARSFCSCCSLEMYRRACGLVLKPAEEACSARRGDVCVSSETLELLELVETRHKEAAAEAAWPRTGDDHGSEGMKFVNFCSEMRAANVGDRMGERTGATSGDAGSGLTTCDDASSAVSGRWGSSSLHAYQRNCSRHEGNITRTYSCAASIAPSVE